MKLAPGWKISGSVGCVVMDVIRHKKRMSIGGMLILGLKMSSVLKAEIRP